MHPATVDLTTPSDLPKALPQAPLRVTLNGAACVDASWADALGALDASQRVSHVEVRPGSTLSNLETVAALFPLATHVHVFGQKMLSLKGIERLSALRYFLLDTGRRSGRDIGALA